MTRHCDYVLVLWADQFEEAPATIFVTALREAGLRVKVVGLTPPPISGSHGLALVPDLTLDQALGLVTQVVCLVIPQGIRGLQRFSDDPRLQKLLDLVAKNRARFVVGPLKEGDILKFDWFLLPALERLIVYPESEDLLKFTHKLIRSLLED